MGWPRVLREDPAVQWLLASPNPSVRFLTLRDVLDEPVDFPALAEARDRIPTGPVVEALLTGQQADGGFGVHPYKKWTGAHWRLVSLVELELPAGDPRGLAGAEQVLGWLLGEGHQGRIQIVNGLTRRCASQEGNALAVCSRLGMARDPRVRRLAESLQQWQWPDGGWNCDKSEAAQHASFYESLAPMWGLWEYHEATGDRGSREAADRTAELFLQHRLLYSERTGALINPEWVKLHYPLYWHYDLLQGLLMLGRMGKLADVRAHDALDLLEQKRLKDGRWRPGNYYWSPLGTKRGHQEVVDWGRGGPNEMITLNALRVLHWAGRLA